MSTPPEFEPFQSIPRLKRKCTITEKIDGTNAQIFISEDGEIFAASRSRWITPEDDNYGFAGWVAKHAEELKALGPGRHFGEWWGAGIQRRYGLKEKKFSLFNVSRWNLQTPESTPPPCCGVVPVLYEGDFSSFIVDGFIAQLERDGSVAAPGFMQPEGIVIYLPQARSLFKVTLGGDGHKSQNKNA
jgi:hypothetical protein